MADRYHFSFAWQSSYGHIVRLMEQLAPKPGLLLDLGCGHGAVAEPLRERGFEYVGADIEGGPLAQLAERGFETHELDLTAFEQIPERLVKIADGRHVAGVLLLDVLEHIYPTPTFLAALREGLVLLERPPLFVSVPNVAHTDVGAKLAFGRWDLTPTGLLDDTHVSFFTDERLADETRKAGLVEIRANDFRLPVSDQHFPADHPALAPASPVARLLRSWRSQADPHGDTNQFIRAYLPTELAAEPIVLDAPPERFATVLMRTQGRRPANLREALTCLAAQTCDDFDVLLLAHVEDDAAVADLEALVGEFHPTFSHRVRVVPVAGGGRSRPLNVGLDMAAGRYVCFLDDDDLVTANWIEEFKAVDGGGFLRSTTVERKVAWPEPGEHLPYQVVGALDTKWDVPFEMVRQLWQNHTPICSFALSRAVIDGFSLRFDEELPVIEDWHLLMRAALVTDVVETGEITSIYHKWQRGESSTSLHDEQVWQTTHRMLLREFDELPLVLPPGSATRLERMWHEAQQAHHTRERMEALERSRWWRITRRPAAVVDRLKPRVARLRSLAGRVKRRLPS